MSATLARSTETEREIAFLLFFAVALLLLLFHRTGFSSSDEAGAYEITRSIVEHKSLQVPEIRHTYVGRNGHRYSHFAIGQSALAVPFYIVGSAAPAMLPESAAIALAGPGAKLARVERSYRDPQIFAVLLYPPLATGVLAALFYLFERRLGASRRSAVASTLILTTCTHLALMGTLFLRHTSEAVLILASFLFFYRFKLSGADAKLWKGSLFASLLLLVRVPATVAGPGLGAYAAAVVRGRHDRDGAALARAGALLLVPPVLALALHMALNQQLWGTFLESPMVSQRGRFGLPAWRSLLGLLVSPGAGLVVYSPILLLTPWTFVPFWRRHRAEALTILGIFATFLLFVSSFEIWHGLWASPGPRYLASCIPLLLLPLGPWIDRASRRARWLALAPLAALGALFQIGLMATHWWSLAVRMGYPSFQPKWGFLFVPELSPVLAALRQLPSGELADLWLLRIAVGWPGAEPHPVAAAVLTALLLLGIAACSAAIWRRCRLEP